MPDPINNPTDGELEAAAAECRALDKLNEAEQAIATHWADALARARKRGSPRGRRGVLDDALGFLAAKAKAK